MLTLPSVWMILKLNGQTLKFGAEPMICYAVHILLFRSFKSRE